MITTTAISSIVIKTVPILTVSHVSIGGIRISVVLRNSDGEMIGSRMDFPEGLTANNSILFSVKFYGNNSSDISSVDVFAEPWGFEFKP